MKTIGLIGGTSWYSTVDYYRSINETVNKRLGSNTSAKILLYSVNFEEIVTLTKQDNWAGIENILSTAAKKLEIAGADCMLLCANTMHIVASQVQAAIGVPLLHVAEVVAGALNRQQIKTVLLLGTRYTMQGDFYTYCFQEHGIKIVIPNKAERELINDSIYNELGKGILLEQTKKMYLDVIEKNIIEEGIEGVILGCTEIPLLIKQVDCTIPVFDSTLLHATAAVDFALSL